MQTSEPGLTPTAFLAASPRTHFKRGPGMWFVCAPVVQGRCYNEVSFTREASLHLSCQTGCSQESNATQTSLFASVPGIRNIEEEFIVACLSRAIRRCCFFLYISAVAKLDKWLINGMILINKNAKLLPYKRNDNANVDDANVRLHCVVKMPQILWGKK